LTIHSQSQLVLKL